MSDTVPLLPEDPELSFSEPQSTNNLRVRAVGSNNSYPYQDDGEGGRSRRESVLSQKRRCCKQTITRQRRSPKYSIALVASTWGFLTNIERAIILPTMWLYFQKTWGDGTAKSFYGSTLGVFSLSILLATPMFGYAGHANVNVKYLLLFANLLEIVGNVAYLLAQNPWLVFLGRLIAGLGASCESPMYADLTRATEVKERTPYIIVLLLSRQVGLIFGPAFTLILHRFTFEIGPVVVSVYNGPGLVMACLWVLHSVLIYFIYPRLDKAGNVCDDLQPSDSALPAPRQSPENRTQPAFGGYWQYNLLTLYATTFASYFSVMALESVLSPVANRYFEWTEVEVSYVYIGASVLIIVMSGVMHLMSKCVEDRKLVLFGLVLLSSGYIYLSCVVYTMDSFSKALGPTLVVFGVAIHVAGMPFPLAISESLYTKFIPAQYLDQAQTILRTVINVAFLMGPFIGGQLQGTPTAVFLSMLGLTLLPLALFISRFSAFVVPAELSLKPDSPSKLNKSPDSHLSVL